MTKSQLIEALTNDPALDSEDVFALSSDGIPFEISGITTKKGLLCITEGDEAEWPEGEEDDDEEGDDLN